MEDQAPQSQPIDDLATHSANVIRELQSRAEAALASRRERLAQLESEIGTRLEAIENAVAAECAEDAAASKAELERLRGELEASHAAWQESRAEEETESGALREELSRREAELAAREAAASDRDAELAEREAELERRGQSAGEQEQALQSLQARRQELEDRVAEQESKWAAERAELESAREEAARKLDEVAAEFAAAREEWTAKLSSLEEKLASHETDSDHERSRNDAARIAAEQERDKLAHELLATRDKLKKLDELASAASERDEIKQKFELALADVQRFRATVAELEEELARRPEAGAADSAEMTHLRAERDALAARVEALESESSSKGEDEDTQQLADLQRRFEMAVEDVRELKTRNAELESRLVARGPALNSGNDAGGMDWESQKRRLLASLEGESGEIEPEREEERLAIQSTIAMTDAVVSEKDRQIEELQSRLNHAEESAADSGPSQSEAIEALLDSDEILGEHRAKAEQLNAELQEKLRAAELELSVERAKIAREKAEVEEWRLEMETFRKAREGGEEPAEAGAPRRRWLSKLGLNGDDK